MKRFTALVLTLLILCSLMVPVCADIITRPQTPIDKMGQAGGPLLINGFSYTMGELLQHWF